MTQTFEIGPIRCLCSTSGNKSRVAYILYPMDMLSGWIEAAAKKYDASIVVITGMDWESVFSPWPAKGVPKGSPDFKGESPEFLQLLRQKIVPEAESALGIDSDAERTLVGVSMSGLFALWQWMECDTFRNIASLSGSFWFEGFVDWIKSRPIPAKKGRGFFLLGDQESKSNVKAFNSVEADTLEIIALLRAANVDAEFVSVPGNHFADPIPRLEKAMAAIYGA